MKKIFLLILTISNLICIGQIKNHEDSLKGFDYKELNHHLEYFKGTDAQKQQYIERIKRRYITKKYSFETTKNLRNGNNSTLGFDCTNIGFESGDTTGWQITGTYVVTSGTGHDSFGNFPLVYPTGGNHSLRLGTNDTATTNFQSSATRVIAVTAANAYLNLHYAIDILDYPHVASAAAKFSVNFFDPSGDTISCPRLQCYYYQNSGNVGADFGAVAPQTTPTAAGINMGGQNFPVLYQDWQTITVDLTPYIGSNITCKVNCDWCIYNYDWAYCYIDADCDSSYSNSMHVVQSNPLCTGGSTTLMGPPGMSGYSWSGPVNGTSQNLATSTPGNYTLNITQIGACHYPPLYYTVAQISATPPTVSISASQNPVCSGATTTLTANGANTYMWSNTAATKTITASPIVNVTYTVVGKDTSNGCINYAITTITVSTSPTVTVNSPKLCTTGAGTVALNVTVTPAGTYTYAWTPTVGLSSSSIANPTAVLTNTTVVYTITVSPSAGCHSIITSSVSVRPRPTITVPSLTTCIGYVVNLTASGASTYTWNTGATGSVLSVSPSVTTNYSVTGANSYSCANTFTVMVKVNPLPIIGVTPSHSLCIGDSLLLKATGANTYTWMPATFLSSISSATVLSTPSANITYTVRGTDVNQCIGLAASTLSVFSFPISNFSVSSYSSFISLPLQFTDMTTGAITTNWQWFFGDGTNATVQNPSHTYNAVGAYTIELINTSSNGCMDTSYQSVEIIAADIKTYNSFSPNGDGLNDVFEIDNIADFTPNHVYIYNRYGQLLWEADNYNNVSVAWNGTDKAGEKIPPGTYFYLIEINGKKTEKHWVELIR